MTVDDHLAPYVCLGCHELYRVCPDPLDHNCPKCGEKVIPKKLLNARERNADRYTTCTSPCDIEVFRASGDVVCETCGEIYYEHKRCLGSAYDPGYGRPVYATHVLCDGLHVHL